MNDRPNSDEPQAPSADKAGGRKAGSPRKISAAELDGIMAAHELWLETREARGSQADLSHADLTTHRIGERKLEKVNLRHAKLQHENLTEVDLNRANLAHARLSGAVLIRAKLRRAFLEEADLSGSCMLQANCDWASFHRADLRGAELREASLQQARLVDANLRQADLRRADLRHASLHGARLEGAKLEETDFTDANLQHANFDLVLDTEGKLLVPPADVKGASFRNADLSDSSLAEVSGLQASQLAGSNLSSARLPDDIKQFEALDHVAEISKHARTIFLGVVGACVYSWLSIATTTDVALITGSTATPLPIIQTPVSIAGFYWAAPPILFVLYIYLHLYLQRMWEGMAELPAIFPDGRTLDQRVYPWLLSGLVASNVALLKQRRPPSSWLQVGLSVIAAWGLVPFTLFLFWGRYLVRHDWPWTVWHLVLFLAASAYGFAAYRLARATLRGEDPEKQEILGSRDIPTVQHLLNSLRHVQHRWVVAAAVLTVMLSLGAIEGRPGGTQDDWRAWIPSPTTLFGLRTAADLTEVDVSVKPTTWTGLSERSLESLRDVKGQEEKARTELAQVKGAQLGGVDLRNAQARGVFLARADLREADLRGADLQGANLAGANLAGANLEEAKLTRANLKGANLAGANLLRAELLQTNMVKAQLPAAILQEANLFGAFLQETNLFKAVIKGAKLAHSNLTKADLRGAVLFKANFSLANLSGAKITQEQLNSACGDHHTQLDEGLTIQNCASR